MPIKISGYKCLKKDIPIILEITNKRRKKSLKTKTKKPGQNGKTMNLNIIKISFECTLKNFRD